MNLIAVFLLTLIKASLLTGIVDMGNGYLVNSGLNIPVNFKREIDLSCIYFIMNGIGFWSIG
jgi:hypothetical protein